MPKKKLVSIRDITDAPDDEKRSDFIKTVIFERSIELFLEKGFSSTSMNDLAEACSVSKPALYYYVPSKVALLEMLYEHVTKEFFDAADMLAESGESPATRLRNIILHQVDYNIRQHRFLTVFWRERAYFDSDAKRNLARRERRFEERVISLLEEGRASGEFRQSDSKLSAMALLGLLSTVQRWARHTGASPEQISASIVDLLFNGLIHT